GNPGPSPPTVNARDCGNRATISPVARSMTARPARVAASPIALSFTFSSSAQVGLLGKISFVESGENWGLPPVNPAPANRPAGPFGAGAGVSSSVAVPAG